MKQLYLKIQYEAVKLSNVMDFKRKERNNLIDERKKAKKAKETEIAEDCTRKINQCDETILDLEVQYKDIERKFNELRHKCGKLRLDMYLFADILYSTLIEYESFINQYVVNKDGDNDVMNNVRQAIDHIKQLPYEIADDSPDMTNQLYGAITDKFMERWMTIRDGVMVEVLRDVDREFAN